MDLNTIDHVVTQLGTLLEHAVASAAKLEQLLADIRAARAALAGKAAAPGIVSDPDGPSTWGKE